MSGMTKEADERLAYQVTVWAVGASLLTAIASVAVHFYGNTPGYELFLAAMIWLGVGVALAVYALARFEGQVFRRRRLGMILMWLATPLSAFALLETLIAVH